MVKFLDTTTTSISRRAGIAVVEGLESSSRSDGQRSPIDYPSEYLHLRNTQNTTTSVLSGLLTSNPFGRLCLRPARHLEAMTEL